MKKRSNLENYYYQKVQLVEFEELNEFQLEELELSEGFRKFLVRKIWTDSFLVVVVLLACLSVLFGVYLNQK